jgi:copper(I)-binding protein
MRMSAGYLTLSNNTAQTITIDRVASPEFESVAMHESVLENGISRMLPLDTVAIPGGESVQFRPGGKHLMLMRPTGDTGSATLEFYFGDALLLTVDATMSD